MKLTTALLVTASLTLSACSSTPEFLGERQCQSIGCGKNITSYPNEDFMAEKMAKRHGFEWGKTSSAFSPKDPRHHQLKEEEIKKGETPWHWNQ